MEFFGELGDKQLQFYIIEQSDDLPDELAYVYLLKSKYRALVNYRSAFYDEKDNRLLHLELIFSSYEEFAEAKTRANGDIIGRLLTTRARGALSSVDRNRRMARGLLQEAQKATD